VPAIAQRRSAEQLKEQAKGWDWQFTQATEGEVLDLIHGIVRVHKPSVCVETGTLNGHGTEAIASALVRNDRGHLWTVENNPEYKYHPMDRVTFVGADSTLWDPPGNIDFAFVDCGPPDVRFKAMARLLPFCQRGAILCTHDNWFYTDEFTAGMSKVIGKPPNIMFPALNGVAVWVFDG
jgi:predicted O-methyltransferase YrrM